MPPHVRQILEESNTWSANAEPRCREENVNEWHSRERFCRTPQSWFWMNPQVTWIPSPKPQFRPCWIVAEDAKPRSSFHTVHYSSIGLWSWAPLLFHAQITL